MFLFWELKYLLEYLKNSINRGFATGGEKERLLFFLADYTYASSHTFFLEFLWECWACKANFSLVKLEIKSRVVWTN